MNIHQKIPVAKAQLFGGRQEFPIIVSANFPHQVVIPIFCEVSITFV